MTSPSADENDASPKPHGPVSALPLRMLRPVWPLALFATVVGAFAGLASAALIAAINRALHAGGGEIWALVLAFAGLGAVAVLGEIAGNIGSSMVGQRIIAALRRELSDKILTAPLAELERIKVPRLIASLDRDVSTIGVFIFSFSSLAIAFAIIVGCFAYLVWLSPQLSLVAIVAAAIDIIVQAVAGQSANKSFDMARSGYDDLQKQYRALIEGAKELRINRARRLRLRENQLHPTIEKIRDRFVRAISSFFFAKGFNSAAFFMTLLVVIAIGLNVGIDKAALSGFVLVLLYVRGPIEQVVSSLPLFAEARVSLRRVAELSDAFARAEPSLVQADMTATPFRGETIEMRNVRYTFPATPGRDGFALGPINLTIRRGEMLFISGVNGSGKTTLIKLLLGLYEPSEGQLLCDNVPVDHGRRDAYRQLFSAIFFDYFLFDDLVGVDDTNRHSINGYLERLEIAHKVTVHDDTFSTIDLSTGQRKRLALIHVLLEDRPIVVLDEWAADQDPAFRAVFYLELLLELKRLGKTLIVVSHDDRYFSMADRLTRMEAGQIVEVTPVTTVQAPVIAPSPRA